jgi:hypothetical protein
MAHYEEWQAPVPTLVDEKGVLPGL